MFQITVFYRHNLQSFFFDHERTQIKKARENTSFL